MAFSASPPAPATPPGEKIAASGFWPEIDINHFRDAMRIGGTTLTTARIKNALLDALITVGMELSAWGLVQVAAGHNTLAAVPALEIDGISRLVHLWRRAVYGWAAADLSETHRDITATADGANRAADVELTADDHRRNAVHAIRDLLGRTRTSVELI